MIPEELVPLLCPAQCFLSAWMCGVEDVPSAFVVFEFEDLVSPDRIHKIEPPLYSLSGFRPGHFFACPIGGSVRPHPGHSLISLAPRLQDSEVYHVLSEASLE